jgi:hypothetical protein
LLLYSSKPSLGVFQLAGHLLHIFHTIITAPPLATWVCRPFDILILNYISIMIFVSLETDMPHEKEKKYLEVLGLYLCRE